MSCERLRKHEIQGLSCVQYYMPPVPYRWRMTAKLRSAKEVRFTSLAALPLDLQLCNDFLFLLSIVISRWLTFTAVKLCIYLVEVGPESSSTALVSQADTIIVSRRKLLQVLVFVGLIPPDGYEQGAANRRGLIPKQKQKRR